MTILKVEGLCKAYPEFALRDVSFSMESGSVMGFTVVGLGLLDISVWFFLLRFVFKLEASAITSAMLTFGMGASSMALFARVGGGIFTKAADVGADLVGKVEAGIPEDDPRNPAVIADNVGDNVGDVAGMGADLYESYVGSIISASALGVAAFSNQAFKAMAIPMVMAAVGILCSIIGSFFVKTEENADQRTLLKALSRGTNLSAILIAVVSFFLVWALLGLEHWGLYVAILSGLVAGVLILTVGSFSTSTASLDNLFPLFAEGRSPWACVISIVAITPWLFVGFDTIPQTAEEFDFPPEKSRRLMINSIVCGALLYALVLIAVAIIIPYTDLLGQNHSWTTGAVANMAFGRFGGVILAIPVMAGIFTGMNGFFMATTRLLFSMGRGKFLHPSLIHI